MSSSERAMLVDTVARVLADHTAGAAPTLDDTHVDEALWAVLHDLGLTTLGVPEALGGAGGTRGDGLVVVEELARHGSRLPVGEHLLAGWVAAAAGLALPEGRATLAPVAAHVVVDRGAVAARAVPWARGAATVVRVASGPDGALVELRAPGTAAAHPGANVAGEPRDELRWPAGDGPLASAVVGSEGDGSLAARVRRWEALVRGAQTIGALGAAQALTLEHVTTRVQFGRPVANFQVVRHLCAVMAGEVAVATAAHRTASRPLDEAADEGGGEPDAVAVAASKLRGAQAATRVSAIAHELHGAIGTTREHRLHLHTRRLWAGRDEGGTEAEWEAELGAWAQRAGAAGLWALVTGSGQGPLEG